MRHSRKNGTRKEHAIAPEHILEVRGLNVHIKVDDYVLHAVRGVSFDMKKGETLGLVGESGCGKSVTSKEILGINPDNCSSPLYTIGNQLGEIVRIHQPETSKNGARERVLEMLKKVGIANPEKRIDQYPHEFSGGMLQRALIAMMLCCNPDLLIADEPTTALDVTIQAQILELMRSLQKEFGMSILFITHDLGTVANMCDNVAVMYLGQIVEYGTVRQIFHDPRHPYTKGLLRSLPKMDQDRGDKLFVIDGVVPLPVDLPPSCGFHDRCPSRIEGVCGCRDIAEYEAEPGHMVRCALMEEKG